MAKLILFGSQFYCKQYLESGWSSPERDIVWSNAKMCRLVLPSHPISTSVQVTISFQPYLPASLVAQRIIVHQGGEEVLCRDAGSSGYLEIRACKSRLDVSQVILDFHFPDAEAPCTSGTSKDSRELAIALRHAIIQDIFPNPFRIGNSNLFVLTTEDRSFARDFIWKKRLEDSQLTNYLCDRHDDRGASLGDLLRGYIAGVGSEVHIRRRLAQKIVNAAQEQGEEAGLFSGDLVLNRDSSAVSKNNLSEFVAASSSFPPVERRLWQREANLLRIEAFPVGYGAALTSASIPGFSIFSSAQYDVHASADNFCISHKFTRSFLKEIISQDISLPQAASPTVRTYGRVVLLQDRFDCGNIAHFLFDSMTRMLHYIEVFGVNENDLFVFGGIPNEFHEIILYSICNYYGVPIANIVFPAHMIHFQADVGAVWFSDQVAYCHPSQRMHPRSIAAIERIARLCGQSVCSGRRLFVSRADASLRGLLNENEIVALASKFGFEKIILSDYGYREQIEIMSSASHIIAPHGMGLTHLALNLHNPVLVELFNPEIGSDAYAWMALGLGFSYYPIAGQETDQKRRDFRISPEVLRVVLEDIFSADGNHHLKSSPLA